jgi:hypothetical protein
MTVHVATAVRRRFGDLAMAFGHEMSATQSGGARKTAANFSPA